jgi:hypothetical protein
MELFPNKILTSIEIPAISRKNLLSVVKNTASTSRKYNTEIKRILQPLQGNETPEIALYGKYVETRDPSTLIVLRELSTSYLAVARELQKIAVPDEGVVVHIGATNALIRFGSVINALIDSKDDPIASLSLLKSFNDSEKNMVESFGRLGYYLTQKNRE